MNDLPVFLSLSFKGGLVVIMAARPFGYDMTGLTLEMLTPLNTSDTASGLSVSFLAKVALADSSV